MTTEAKFKHILIELMEKKPLSDINVTLLCKTAGCHRQTFYYHYQDIYDLLSAIFLNEKVEGLDKAKTPKEILYAFLDYGMKNFSFLRAVYDSAARDLVDEFFYSKIMVALQPLLLETRPYNIGDDAYRLLSRRFGRMVGDEFGYVFRDISITPTSFQRSMKRFIDVSVSTILPALATACGKERPGK